MTTFDVQCYLGILGYLGPGQQDGIPGPITSAAVKSFQRDYSLVPDGIVGPLTEKMMIGVAAGTVARKEPAPDPDQDPAADDAAQYLQADGCYHIPRGVDVQLTRNFRARDIHCQGVGCCTESVISKRVLETAQAIWDELGEPLTIATSGGSGYRCPRHNADPSVGGAANSLHTSGNAVDLHYRSPARLKSIALHHVTDGEIGLYVWGCHVGVWSRGYVSQFNG